MRGLRTAIYLNSFLFLISYSGLCTSTRAAILGVYQGAGCIGASKIPDFENYIGRKLEYVLDFLPLSSWKEQQGAAKWIAECWRPYNKTLVLSIPLVPPGGDLRLAGDGAYNNGYRSIGMILAASGFSNAIIRLGWEANGGWYPWASAQAPHEYIRAWQRAVKEFRAVPGSAFRFDWTIALGLQQIGSDKFYPGDDYVDIIGIDVYNQSWSPGPKTPEDRWKEIVEQPFGLQWHRDFAASRKRPTSFPEWGTGTRPDGHGAGDDPYFIEKMAIWIAETQPLYHAYWNYRAPDIDAELLDGRLPLSAARFRACFGSSSNQSESSSLRCSPQSE